MAFFSSLSALRLIKCGIKAVPSKCVLPTVQQSERCRKYSSRGSSYVKDISLIGVPFSGGQPRMGVEEGPQVLRDAGLIQRIEGLGRTVHDLGDVIAPTTGEDGDGMVQFQGNYIRSSKLCGEVNKKVAKMVAEGARNDDICVTVGGDHSIAVGTLFGHKSVRKDMCILWIDAHTDINTFETTTSGNLHGMPLSFLVKGLPDATGLPGYEWTSQCINPLDIAYIGLRDIDPGEYEICEKLGIMTFSMFEVDRYGIANVVERAIEAINPRLDRPIHLSYDIDSLDPSVSPSTGTAVHGGLTLREGLYISEYVNKLGLLGALDIVEVNPKIGYGEKDATNTIEAAIKIVESSLGKHRSGYVARKVYPFRY